MAEDVVVDGLELFLKFGKECAGFWGCRTFQNECVYMGKKVVGGDGVGRGLEEQAKLGGEISDGGRRHECIARPHAVLTNSN